MIYPKGLTQLNGNFQNPSLLSRLSRCCWEEASAEHVCVKISHRGSCDCTIEIPSFLKRIQSYSFRRSWVKPIILTPSSSVHPIHSGPVMGQEQHWSRLWMISGKSRMEMAQPSLSSLQPSRPSTSVSFWAGCGVGAAQHSLELVQLLSPRLIPSSVDRE